MGYNYDQNRKFTEYLFDEPLEKAIGWIGENCWPEDVFSNELLERWAGQNKFVTEQKFDEEIDERDNQIQEFKKMLQHAENEIVELKDEIENWRDENNRLKERRR